MKINQEIGNIFVTQMDSTLPLAPTTMAAAETLLPLYQSPVCDPKASVNNNKDDSGLTYNMPTTRKRPRGTIAGQELNANFILPQKATKLSAASSFLDRDIVSQIRLQQSEIDHFIAHHVILSPSFVIFFFLFFLNWVLGFSMGSPNFFYLLSDFFFPADRESEGGTGRAEEEAD